MKIGNIELKWLGHSSFLIKNSKIIYIDPYNLKECSLKADIILITHSHYDHCSLEDLKKIVKTGTIVLAPADCQSKIMKIDIPVNFEFVEPGMDFQFGNVKISSMCAYNIDKSFHPREEDWLGYIIKFEEIIVYHAGDSDAIPEMQKLTGYKQPNKEFIVLLPIGGRFTMSSEEAFEVAKMLKPSLVIPMHYGSIVGDSEDAKEFKELCESEGLKVEVLERE